MIGAVPLEVPFAALRHVAEENDFEGFSRSIISRYPARNSLLASGFFCVPTEDTDTVPPTGSPSKHQSKLASSLQQTEGITVMPLLCQYAPSRCLRQ